LAATLTLGVFRGTLIANPETPVQRQTMSNARMPW
jgi:hypothetical protein